MAEKPEIKTHIVPHHIPTFPFLQEIKNLAASVHVLQVYYPYDLPNLQSTVRGHWKIKVPVLTYHLLIAKQDSSLCCF